MNNYLIREEKYDQLLNKAYEGMLAQGNGYLSVRASFEEGIENAPQNEIYTRSMKSVTTEKQRNTISKYGTFVPTIMGHHPLLRDVIINLPYFMDFKIYLDGKKIDMINSNISEYNRSLNMRNGVLKRSFVISTENGAMIRIDMERFASMESKHLFVQMISYEVLEGSALMEIESGIDTDITTNGYEHFKEYRAFEATESGINAKVVTDLDFEVYMISKVTSNTKADWEIKKEHKKIAYCSKREVRAGMAECFTKLSVVTTSRDFYQNYVEHGQNILQEQSHFTYQELFYKNEQKWKEKWLNCDVIVKGNDELQKGIRFSIYHLLRSNHEDDYRVQICAKGFAGEAYYGRYFWDSEIYLLPFYIYTNPKAAKNMLLYRYYTLDGARKNAERYHSKGARYPWQSGLTGEEQCSLWEYADNEVHITADVAYAIMHYYNATNDYEFMRDYGVEILLETARFWTCRVDKDLKGNYHLLNVMGPDEYSPMTRDNAFTNRMVMYNLSSAIEMGAKVKEKSPEEYVKLMEKISFEPEELEEFKIIADNMTLPYDEERDLYLQSADFEDYGEIDINGLWNDRNKAFGHFVTQEKIYRTKCIKQADIIALMTLFPEEFTNKQAKIAYDYYMPLTTHDSSLSPAGHSFIANRIGREEDVHHFMKQALAVDLSLLKKGTEEGIHIANCGCIWQLIIMSFAGMESGRTADEFKITPNMPKDIEGLSFKVWFRGEQKMIKISNNGKSIIID
ncbi:maltose phosphorylase [Clostridium sediminicola]|uniref:glycoside hydrolase family 65 protein n=1 Tax=Clostridium sediminicola TaxID=3114879 RepID=UPI0031F22B5A